LKIAVNAMLLRQPYSGVEVAIHNLIKAVAAQAPQWEFLAAVPADFAASTDMPGNISLHRAPGWTRDRAGRIVWEQLAFPGVLRRQKVSLLHAPGYVMPLRWRGPTVLSVYDITALTHPQWCKPANVWHYRLMLPRSVRRADRVLVPSEYVGNELVNVLGVDRDKIRVVALGIDAVFRRIEDATVLAGVRRKYGLPKEYLLCVGNITPRKNIEGVVELFEHLVPDLPHHLAVVGAKPHKRRDVLRRIEGSPVRERIHMLGYVPAEDLAALYSGAGACLHLAHYEGFGLTPLEAMACGTPVVVSTGGALPEVAGPGALTIHAVDAEAVKLVKRVLSDFEYRGKLVERGRAHAAGFTWSAAAQKVISVYREVVAERG